MLLHRRAVLTGAGATLAAPFVITRPARAATTFEQAKQSGRVAVGLANEKPYAYVDPDGTVTGAIVEVLRAALKPYGITGIEASAGAFGTLLPGVMARRFDVIGAGMFISPKRCAQIAFTDPITRVGGAFAAKADNPKDLHSLKDVATNPAARIGGQLGTSQVDEIKQAGIAPAQISLFATDDEALAGLQAGRVDVIYFPDLELNTLLRTHGDTSLARVSSFKQLVGADGQPAYNHQAFGLRKEDADFVAALDSQLGAMLKDGRLLAAMAPFGFTESELPDPANTAAKLCAAS